MIEALINTVFAIGLCYAGLAILTINTNKIGTNYSKKIKQLITRKKNEKKLNFISIKIQDFVLGVILGAILNKPSISASVLCSMNTIGLLSLKRALSIMCFSSLGGLLFLFLFSLDLTFAFSISLGLSGILYGFVESGLKKYIIRSFFGISLVLLGIFSLKNEPTQDFYNLLEVLFTHAEYYGKSFSFLIGFVASLIMQSGILVILMLIDFGEKGLLNLYEIFVIMCGTRVGSSFMSVMTLGTKTSQRKWFAFSQISLYTISSFICILLVIIEQTTGVPIIIGFVQSLNSKLSLQVVSLAFIFNGLSIIAYQVIENPLINFMTKRFPLHEDQPDEPKYLPEVVFEDPDSGLDLIFKEQVRLMENIHKYLQYMKSIHYDLPSPITASFRDAYYKLGFKITAFLSSRPFIEMNPELLTKFLNTVNLEFVIEQIIQVLYGFRLEIDKKKPKDQSKEQQEMIGHMLESMDFEIEELILLMKSIDVEDFHIQYRIAESKIQYIKSLEEKYVSIIKDKDELENILILVEQFEVIGWILKRFLVSLEKLKKGID